MVALMRLGTNRSLATMKEALRDRAPQIRMEAAAALVGRREGNVTSLLLGALDHERDEEVTASLLLALGQLATPEAVARLVATAQPEKGLFRKKAVTHAEGFVPYHGHAFPRHDVLTQALGPRLVKTLAGP